MLAHRQEALARLADFVPRAGRDYASDRNHDFGPDARDNVSVLSPWIRYRLLTEQEVVAATLERHSLTTAEKFVQEVCWRTYWKGWLEMRPGVWREFLAAVAEDRARVDANAGLRKAFSEAENGHTGLDAFDAWAQELVETGYLHNHARMWFASIWIFTLKLPWTLGADFFQRHLLDADPASNTLSWRWVAGIQTQGKTYLARPDNVAKFTGGRFRPTALALDAPPVAWPPPPRPTALPDVARPSDLTGRRSLLLVHPEDLHPESLVPRSLPLASALAVKAFDGTWPFGEKANAFVAAGIDDAASRVQDHFEIEAKTLDRFAPDSIVEACRAVEADTVVTPYAPVGPVADALESLEGALREAGLGLARLRRDWDELAWIHATKGFFPFKKQIPALLEGVGLR
ncbi:MAG: FAD-binding domain-containing protein [Myxococcota bacterium]